MKKELKIVSIAGFLLALLTGTWLSTQRTAALLNYDAALGTPLFTWGDTPIYLPKFFWWWYKFSDQAPDVFDSAFTIFYLSVIVGIAIPVILKMRQKPELSSHGAAKWANEKEIKKTSLLDGRGVVLGLSDNGKYLRHDGPQHCLVMAPTRSGKGVGIIIPTLLTWPHSVLVTDIKGENWGITAGYRKSQLHNKVIKFEPTASEGSAQYNPFDEIRIRSAKEVSDVQNIANIMVDPQGKGDLDHWKKSAQTLLVGVILHLKYAAKNTSFGSVVAFLSNPNKTFQQNLEEMLATEHDTTGAFSEIYGMDTRIHPMVAQTAREMLNKPEEELGSILSTAMSLIAVYRDPVLAHNTARSDFSVNDLMNYDQPVSLYLVVPPSDLDRMNPVFRLIIELIMRRLTEKMEFKEGKAVQSYKHRLLLLVDEFPGLGRLDTFERSLAYIAGYGLKALLIVQSLNQLNKIYTRDNSIADNCHIRVFHTPNDAETPQYISRMLGSKTIEVTSSSSSGGFIPNVSHSTQSMSRELMRPEEVSQMPPDREIIMVSGFPPIYARKLFYFKDSNFTKRLKQAPEKTDVLYEEPTNKYQRDVS